MVAFFLRPTDTKMNVMSARPTGTTLEEWIHEIELTERNVRIAQVTQPSVVEGSRLQRRHRNLDVDADDLADFTHLRTIPTAKKKHLLHALNLDIIAIDRHVARYCLSPVGAAEVKMHLVIRSVVMLSFVATLNAQRSAAPATFDTPGDVTIDTDTSWPEGAYAIDNLTITGGATLSVAGGSTVTVSGTLSVTGNSILLLQGKNTGGLIDGEWQGVGVTVNAGRVTVDAGSAISADGQGYVGKAGPGAGASDPACGGPTAGGGGAYGGAGGNGSFGAHGGSPYGSPDVPTDLGSGGGNNPGCGQTSTANAGGGAIRLAVTGTLQLDGMITANGASGLADRLGGGAGGSISVTASTLTGSGSFAANGADGGSPSAGGGGGGRIAVAYTKAPAFTGFTTSTADGGNGFTPGEIGTVAFFDTSAALPHLYVYRSLVFGQDSTLTYESITLDNGATLRVGGGSTIDVSQDLTVMGNSTLVLEGKNISALVDGQWQGSGVTVNAAHVAVTNGSAISADGQGYVGTAGPGRGESDDRCYGPTAGGGGAYGGAGGDEMAGVHGGSPYGSPTAPTDLGSGGGNNPSCGQPSTANAGGGAIRLIVSGTLQLDGTISANGAGALAERLGGGAGGSIYVSTDTLTGAGFFTAGGADAGSASAGGGGGGRIAVYYAHGATFTGFIRSTANGGNGFSAGAPGTVGFFDMSTAPPRLSVYQDLAFGEDAALAYDSITVDNGATLRVGGGSTLDVTGALTVKGKSTLLLEGKNRTGLVTGRWEGAGVTINAGSVVVEAGAAISANGEGYIGTAGPGPGESDQGCYGATAGGGGAYGGTGGDGAAGTHGGNPYGSASAPTDLGSGGGNNPGCNQTATINAGGGAIRLAVSGLLQLDGAITANAAANLPERLGGGAGGAVYVTTTTLIGAGFFAANGADAGSASAGGGGGGRLAVSYANGAAFGGFAASTANGGVGYTAGRPGTVAFADTRCDGDCIGDGFVTVDELITAVNIALGLRPLDACAAVDSDGNGVVTVDDLIRAVNRALNGCGSVM